MKYWSGAQGVILGIGILFMLLTLIIPFAQYNIYYIMDNPAEGVTPVIAVTCPAPIDQPSCDDVQGELRKGVCEDCADYASSKWMWFIIWESVIAICMVGGYILAGRAAASREQFGG